MSGQPEAVETVVVGAGQAGLTMSWHLRQAGREHLVLDRRETLGGGWQDRWDSFQLVTPNWTVSLPGYAYDGSDPDGFMSRDEVTRRIRHYATVIDAPVRLGTAVTRLGPGDDGRGFRLETTSGQIQAREIIVAAGGFHVPRIPPAADGFPARVLQLHSHHYRRESDLPAGAVLVVGSGQSGVQLAEELHEAGRQVFLAVGHCGRLPRRYRGHDAFRWVHELANRGPQFGTPLPSVDELPHPSARLACNPHVSGHAGGHDTNLRQFAAEGMRPVGRFEGADGEIAHFGQDLADNLQFADTFFDERFRPGIDTFIERAGIAADADDRTPFTFEVAAPTELDLAAEGISTVLWTSGYRFAFDWIDFPLFDEQGFPRHVRGVSEVPGLTFIGLPWLLNQASGNLLGFGVDAEYLASRW